MKEEQLSVYSSYRAHLQKRVVFGHDTTMQFDTHTQIALVLPRCTVEVHCHNPSLLQSYTDRSRVCCALFSR